MSKQKKKRDSQAAEIADKCRDGFCVYARHSQRGMAAKLIQAAAVSAVTLSQLAVLYSKPLPKYEKGNCWGGKYCYRWRKKGEIGFYS